MYDSDNDFLFEESCLMLDYHVDIYNENNNSDDEWIIINSLSDQDITQFMI